MKNILNTQSKKTLINLNNGILFSHRLLFAFDNIQLFLKLTDFKKDKRENFIKYSQFFWTVYAGLTSGGYESIQMRTDIIGSDYSGVVSTAMFSICFLNTDLSWATFMVFVLNFPVSIP